jgi:hypothetical protein
MLFTSWGTFATAFLDRTDNINTKEILYMYVKNDESDMNTQDLRRNQPNYSNDNEAARREIAALGHKAHAITESHYRAHPATRSDPAWPEKQRILLADMALHLLQTAVSDGALSTDDLKRNLFAILTVSDQFLPEAGLKAKAGQLQAG